MRAIRGPSSKIRSDLLYLLHGLLHLLQLRGDGVFRIRGGDGGPARLPAYFCAHEPSQDSTDPGGLERRLDACAKTMNARTHRQSLHAGADRRRVRPARPVRPGPARSRAD